MPITELVFTEPTYVVIHDGEGFVQYLEGEPGTALGTGQPHVETFTDEAAARARAEELGFIFPDPEPEEAPGEP